MDSLATVVPTRLDLDIQFMQETSGRCGVLANRVGNGLEESRARTLFRYFFHASAGISITEHEIIIGFGRRVHKWFLLAANSSRKSDPIPSLRNRTLRIRFY